MVEPDPLAQQIERLAAEVAGLRRELAALTTRLDHTMPTMLKQMRERGDRLTRIEDDKL